MDKEEKKSKLAIVDGTYYIFRAFFGLHQKLINKSGMPTNAIYGFKRMLASLQKKIQPEYFAIVFDSSKPSFRDQMYKEYKANRSAMPQDLAIQIPYILNLVDLAGYKKIVIDGVEADDVIGSLANKFKEQTEIWIISADKDLTQLINSSVKMYDSLREVTIGIDEVEKKYGVPPALISDYLALVGDTSDNIPGASGIGPVSAKKILNKFPGIEVIKKNLEIIEGKEGEKIRSSWENITLSHELTKIKCDINLDYSLEKFIPVFANRNELENLYAELNFKADELFKNSEFEVAKNNTQLSKNGTQALNLTSSAKVSLNHIKIDYDSFILITDQDSLKKYLNNAVKSGLLCLDFETSSLNTRLAKIVGVALKSKDQPAAYAPIAHTSEQKQLPLKDFLAAIGLVLNSNITLLGHNIKYELGIFKNHNLDVNCKLEDSMIGAYLLKPEANTHSLDALALNYLGHQNIKYEEVVPKSKQGFFEVEIDQAKRYAAEDAEVTYLLQEIIRPKIKEHDLESLYYDLEMPLTKILCDIEDFGVRLDTLHLKNYSAELKQKLVLVEKQIYKLANKDFNINSPKQLSQVLFEDMGITQYKVPTKTGFSTDQAVLERLSQYPIVNKVIDYRLKTKLINTYLDVLPNLADESGRIHTSYSQTIAATGRLSSSNPNLQNIPVRGEERSIIRKGFIAQKGYRLISADYSQIELRVLAHLSKDESLLDAFNRDVDIHAQTAAKIFEIDIHDVDDEKRAIAKTINFGLIYGMGPQKLSAAVNVTMREASDFIKAYFMQYPKIKDYMKNCIALAKEKGYSQTAFGRKRNIPGIISNNRKERSSAERISMNTPIQGTAADIIKIAMLKLYKLIELNYASKENIPKIIMQIHDELVIESPESEVFKVKELIKDAMENACQLMVKLKINLGDGLNWDEAQK